MSALAIKDRILTPDPVAQAGGLNPLLGDFSHMLPSSLTSSPLLHLLPSYVHSDFSSGLSTLTFNLDVTLPASALDSPYLPPPPVRPPGLKDGPLWSQSWGCLILNLAFVGLTQRLLGADTGAVRCVTPRDKREYGRRLASYDYMTRLLDVCVRTARLEVAPGDRRSGRRTEYWPVGTFDQELVVWLIRLLAEGAVVLRKSQHPRLGEVQIWDTHSNYWLSKSKYPPEIKRAVEEMENSLKEINTFMAQTRVEVATQVPSRRDMEKLWGLVTDREEKQVGRVAVGGGSRRREEEVDKGKQIVGGNSREEERVPQEPIRHPHQVLDINDLLYRRSFSDNLERGGRFYSAVQRIPREVRQQGYIINGLQSVELDYSAYHASIIYHLHGQELPRAGMYVLEKLREDGRDLVKYAVNMALNTRNRDTAVYLVDRFLEAHSSPQEEEIWPLARGKHGRLIPYPWRKRTQRRGLPACLNGISGDEVMSMIELERKPLLDHGLYKSSWTWLHRIDSDICQEVMLTLSRQGVPSISVHDSFVVPVHAEDALRAAMVQAYQNVIGTSMLPLIK